MQFLAEIYFNTAFNILFPKLFNEKRNTYKEILKNDSFLKENNILLQTYPLSTQKYVNSLLLESVKHDKTAFSYILLGISSGIENIDESLIYFKRAQNLQPNNVWIYRYRGYLYYDSESNHEKAIEDFKKSINLDGSYYWDFQMLAQIEANFCQFSEEISKKIEL